jgi:hypothetical protein
VPSAEADSAPIAAEHHARVATERFDIPPQRRDFKRMAIDDDRDGAVLDAGRHRLPACSVNAVHHLVGQGGRRHVDLADRKAQ